MQFVASITREPAKIRKLLRLWAEGGDKRNPFASVLITPLFTHSRSLTMIRDMKESGLIEQVFFDSGGYFVQTGRIDYYEMYWQLLQFYRANEWGDWYILPDYVPSSSDDQDTVWFKVRETAQLSCQFYDEMPSPLRERAVPVVHGHLQEQVEFCLEMYTRLDIQRIGFGSFGTGGKGNSVNTLTPQAFSLLSMLGDLLMQQGIHVHAFGVGTPPVIYLLNKVGVHSFDSVGWMKTAGFGKVYMPLVRAYNITYNDPIARGLTEEQFDAIKDMTNHSCYFCRSFERLVMERDLRMMHNLTVVLDTLEALDTGKAFPLLQAFSPQYARLARELIQWS